LGPKGWSNRFACRKNDKEHRKGGLIKIRRVPGRHPLGGGDVKSKTWGKESLKGLGGGLGGVGGFGSSEKRLGEETAFRKGLRHEENKH